MKNYNEMFRSNFSPELRTFLEKFEHPFIHFFAKNKAMLSEGAANSKIHQKSLSHQKPHRVVL